MIQIFRRCLVSYLIFLVCVNGNNASFPTVPGLPGFLAISKAAYITVCDLIKWFRCPLASLWRFMHNMAPFQRWFDSLPHLGWCLRMHSSCQSISRRTLSSQHSRCRVFAHAYPPSKIQALTLNAAVMNYGNTTQSEVKARRRLLFAEMVQTKASQLLSPLGATRIPLLFPTRPLGGVSMEHSTIFGSNGTEETSQMVCECSNSSDHALSRSNAREPHSIFSD